MKDIANMTLAEIVTENNRAAAIFEKFHLDFCCRGKRTLEHACIESNIPLTEVTETLQNVTQENGIQPALAFDEMNAEQLISHIMLHHHFYVKQIVPQLVHFLSKLFQKHKDNFEWIEEGFETFMLLQKELLAHMQKEELVLFPLIKKLEQSAKEKEINNFGRNILGPVSVMEAEHEEAGKLIELLRTMTNDYTPAENACTTHRVTLAMLKEFEENLHQHIHLENNLLFPLAIKLQDTMVA